MNVLRGLGVLLVCGLGFVPVATAAEPRALAGPAADATSSETELAELEQRFALTRDPRIGLAAARALVDRGRWIEAAALYREVSEVPLMPGALTDSVEAKARAAVERDALLGRIPAVVISVESATSGAVKVFVNGVPLANNELGTKYAVNPGTVRVRGLLEGTRLETVVELREAEVRPVRLVFGPEGAGSRSEPVPEPLTGGELALPSATHRARPSDGSGQRLIGYVALGIGGATLITGGVFGVLAVRDEATLESRCPRDRCSSSLKSDVDSYESKKTIATVGLLGGAALAAGGAVLYLTAGSEPEAQARPHVAVFCDGQQAGVRGSF